MPFTQRLLLNVPTFPLALIVIGFSASLMVVITAIVHFLTFRYFKIKKSMKSAPVLFAAIASIYSILLGIVLFSSWMGFRDTETDVQKGADCLIELYRSTDAFLPAIKNEVRVLLEQYARSIINDEWPSLARSELNPGSTEIIKKVWHIYSTYAPSTQTEQVFLQESVRNLSRLRECRADRLSDSKMGVYPLLWLVLIIGEVIIAIFITLLLEGNLKIDLITASLFGVLIGLIFFAILLFDFPFTGQSFIVSPAPFKEVLSSW